MEKIQVSWDTVNYPSTTLFCLKARVKPVSQQQFRKTRFMWHWNGLGSSGSQLLSLRWGTSYVPRLPREPPDHRCHGKVHCPSFHAQFPLLILQPHFQHVALGQTTTGTDCGSFVLVGEGLVNSMDFTSPQLQNSTLLAIRALALFYLF